MTHLCGLRSLNRRKCETLVCDSLLVKRDDLCWGRDHVGLQPGTRELVSSFCAKHGDKEKSFSGLMTAVLIRAATGHRSKGSHV